MAGCCHDDHCSSNTAKPEAGWRKALWTALAINLGMFLAEIGAGLAAGSVSLQADALDFLGDAANYGVSIAVVGMSVALRARTALLKGMTLLTFALWVVANTVWHALHGTLPHAEVMGLVGFIAIVANGGVAMMLYRFRSGDANMRAVWICTRNDVIGNTAVLLAAGGVFGTSTAWPDIAVAAVMATLAFRGGWEIMSHAMRDMRTSGSKVTSVA